MYKDKFEKETKFIYPPLLTVWESVSHQSEVAIESMGGYPKIVDAFNEYYHLFSFLPISLHRIRNSVSKAKPDGLIDVPLAQLYFDVYSYIVLNRQIFDCIVPTFLFFYPSFKNSLVQMHSFNSFQRWVEKKSQNAQLKELINLIGDDFNRLKNLRDVFIHPFQPSYFSNRIELDMGFVLWLMGQKTYHGYSSLEECIVEVLYITLNSMTHIETNFTKRAQTLFNDFDSPKYIGHIESEYGSDFKLYLTRISALPIEYLHVSSLGKSLKPMPES